MFDPFSLSDPLDSLFDPFGGGGRRRRPAAFPALPEAQADSLAGTLTSGALSGLGYVGSVLDKTFGGRAVRGLLGGHLDELASIIPGSDTVGLTDPTHAVSGEDLVTKHWGLADPGSWGGTLGGLAAEVALDPATYLTLGTGALTKAGLAAKKTGTLAKGLGPGITQGQRALATFAGIPIGTGQTAAKVGTKLDTLGDAIKYAPGVRNVRSLFDPLAGAVSDPTVQRANEFTKHPAKDALLADIRGLHEDWQQRVRSAVDAGADPEAAGQYIRAVQGGLPDATIDRLVPGRAALAPHLGVLDPVADEIRRFNADVYARESGAGVGTKLLGDDFADYGLRRPVAAGGQAGGKGRSAQPFPTGGPSQVGRKKPLRDIPGADLQLEQWIQDPTLRGLTPKAAAAQIEDDIKLGLQETGAGPGLIPYAPGYIDKQVPKKARAVAKFVANTDKRHADEALPFFNQDVLGDNLVRGERSAEVVSGADAVVKVAAGAQKVGGPGRTPVLEVLKKSGLGGTKRSNRAILDRTLRDLGEDPHLIAASAKPGRELSALKQALAPYTLPEGTAKAATQGLQKFVAPTEVKPVLDLYDKGLGFWKDLLYTIWPASHARNLTGGAIENFATSGTKPGVIGEAGSLRKGVASDLGIPGIVGTAEQQRNEVYRRAVAHGVLKRGQGQFGTDRVSVPTTLLEGLQASPSRPRVNPKLGAAGDILGHPIRSGQELGQTVEDNLRLGQFIDLQRQGYNPAEAAKVVEATHFDYGRTTGFERSVMKRLVPFYSFSRRNLPKQLRRAVTEPGKVSVPIRAGTAAQGGNDTYVPEYLRSGFAVPLGPSGPPGTERFLTKLGIPVEEAFGGLKVGTGPLDTVNKTLESAVGSTTPPLKMLVESLTGRQSFTGRKLSDLRPTTVGRLGGLLDEDNPQARLLTQLVGNSPLSRAASTVDKLADERKGLGPKALNLLTGLRVSDVDTQRYKQIDARNAIERLLDGQTGVSEYTRKYVRPEDRDKITPELEMLLRGQQAFAERAKEAAKQKRAKGR